MGPTANRSASKPASLSRVSRRPSVPAAREPSPLRVFINPCEDQAQRATGSPVTPTEIFCHFLWIGASRSNTVPPPRSALIRCACRSRRTVKRFEEASMSVRAPVLRSQFRCKLFLLGAPGHGLGFHDGLGEYVGLVHPKDLTALPAQYRHPIGHHRSLHPFSRQSAGSMHRNAGMLSKLIPGVDRGTRKGSPSFVMFSSPPIGPHRP